MKHDQTRSSPARLTATLSCALVVLGGLDATVPAAGLASQPASGGVGPTAELPRQDRKTRDSDPELSRAGELLAAGDLEGAIAAYRALVEARPGDVEPRLGLATALLQRAELGEAADVLAPLAHEGTEKDAVAAAEVWLRFGHQGKAVELLETASRRSPNSALIFGNLGRALALGREYIAAEAALSRAVALDPGLAQAHFLLGTLWSLTDRREDGLGELEVAAQLEPSNVDYLYTLGGGYFELGRYADAASVFEIVAELAPDNAAAHLQLGRARLELHHLDQAVVEFEQVLEFDPEDAKAAYYLGYLHWRMGRAAVAEPYYRRAVELDPTDAETRYALGVLLYQTDRAAEAVEALRAALRYNPVHADSLFFLGKALTRQGDLESARAVLEEAVSYEPDLAKAWYQLVSVYRGLGLEDEAAVAMERFRAASAKQRS